MHGLSLIHTHMNTHSSAAVRLFGVGSVNEEAG